MNKEAQSQPSLWQRTTTHRFLVWLASPRGLRRFLIFAAWTASIIALFYGIVDWRGRSAWSAFRQDYESRVASLDFQSYIPKEISDSENFAAIPLLQSFMRDDTNFIFSKDNYSRATDLIPDNPPKKGRVAAAPARHFTDLVQWGQAFRAAAAGSTKRDSQPFSEKLDPQSRAQAAPSVLSGLADDDATLGELRDASARPASRYAVKYNVEDPWVILLPHLSKIKQACQRLELRACAELALGQADKALADVKLILYMADSVKTEPFVISYLVRMACFQIAAQPVWEGLSEHAWTDAQLQELQSLLTGYNFLADLQRPMHCEHSMGIVFIDTIRKKGLGTLSDFLFVDARELAFRPPSGAMLVLVGPFVPSGWYDREKIQYATYAGEQLAGTVDSNSKRVYPREAAARKEELTGAASFTQVALHHQVAARLNLPSLMNCLPKSAAAQTTADEAAIACALERYRLANSQFPESFSALAPKFMPQEQTPHDFFTGEAYKYRRDGAGQFILYSVGWNEKDDGGVPGARWFDADSGDWVW